MQRAATEAVPAILIEDGLLLGFLAGRIAEGFISRHATDLTNPNFEYEIEPSLPIRVRFADVTTPLDPEPAYELVERSRIALVVENATAAVQGSTGGCLPPISDAGSEDPLAGQTLANLGGLRVPAMHGPGDNEFVIDGIAGLNHMTSSWMVLPHHLLDGASDVAFAEADFSAHGNPLSMPRLKLSAVEGGGAACTP